MSRFGAACFGVFFFGFLTSRLRESLFPILPYCQNPTGTQWAQISNCRQLTVCDTQCYFRAMTAEIVRLTVLKRMLNKVREVLIKARDVRYVSVPIWRPWRDY